MQQLSPTACKSVSQRGRPAQPCLQARVLPHGTGDRRLPRAPEQSVLSVWSTRRPHLPPLSEDRGARQSLEGLPGFSAAPVDPLMGKRLPPLPVRSHSADDISPMFPGQVIPAQRGNIFFSWPWGAGETSVLGQVCSCMVPLPAQRTVSNIQHVQGTRTSAGHLPFFLSSSSNHKLL